jgi:broad specificity phosphatase PhoE
MTRVILIRHGETDLNRQLRYSGQLDAPLTPLGEAQHERLRARLASATIDRVVCSDLARVQSLAERIAADHGIVAEPEPALREARFGGWEGLTYEEAMARDRQAMVAFNRDTARVAPPGGESLLDLEARARPCFESLIKAQRRRAGALLLLSHSGTLRALLCSLLHIPLDRHWTLRVDAASCTVLDMYPRGPIVETLNDTCHLQGLEP